VVDGELLEAPAPVLPAGRPPRVAHVPSNPLLKGTDLIDPVLRELAAAGRVEYVRAEGLTAAEVRRLYATVDIVADQFRMGIYGVAAAEAMALGRLVVSDVDASVQRAVQDRTGLALPIWKVAAADLATALDGLMADPGPARAMAAAGPGFVREVHSGARSAAALARTLGLAGAGDL
jgi:glycosyltransferase involved in cell wall biosynthesis